MKVTQKIVFETNQGKIVAGLYGDDVPTTVKNFIQYITDGFFDGLIFHRVIPGFVIQGGGFKPGMKETAPSAPIKLEIAPEIKHKRGTFSMARTQVRDSATSQFFICLDDVPSLDNQYAAFGEVLEGIEAVDKIAAVKTGNAGYHQDVPQTDMIITKAYLLDD